MENSLVAAGFHLALRLSLVSVIPAHGYLLLIPGALFLHELLHVLFVPAQTIMRVVNRNGVLGLDFEGPISIERGLLIALAPHLVLWGAAFWLWSRDYLLALPFALAGFSLPADLYAWYHRSLRYE